MDTLDWLLLWLFSWYLQSSMNISSQCPYIFSAYGLSGPCLLKYRSVCWQTRFSKVVELVISLYGSLFLLDNPWLFWYVLFPSLWFFCKTKFYWIFYSYYLFLCVLFRCMFMIGIISTILWKCNLTSSLTQMILSWQILLQTGFYFCIKSCKLLVWIIIKLSFCLKRLIYKLHKFLPILYRFQDFHIDAISLIILK